VIFGLAGDAPSASERRLFAAADPLGFILFARNCVEPTQVRALCGELREIVGRTDAPILIDQEGGRVARLRPPHWPEFPPAARFGALARTALDAALEAVRLNARLIAHELAPLGIDVDCLPVLDVPHRGADPVIGDRAFAADPALIARLGRAACEGLRAGGVLPVIKHVPGHGRALVDSHMALPVVDASQEALEGVDFAPFRALADMPWAMTAHVVYAALDPARPATTSPVVIESIIRGALGFDGVLVSDDLCMNALDGSPAERTRASLAAGCDVALHCNGDLAAMTAIAEACPPLTPAAMRRLARANAWRRAPEPFDPAAARARVDALLGSAVA
jgi:beta-N-acetylhexosaminidase